MTRNRKDQLVSEYLENISGDVLKDYPRLVRQHIKGRHGIYALYKDTRLYYVGLASNLSQRIKHHLKDRHARSWNRFSIYMTIDQQHMKDLESLFLRIAQPSGNKVKGKFTKATRLNQKLMREVADTIAGKFGESTRKTTSTHQIRSPKKSVRKGPALAPYVQTRLKIRMQYKGKTLKARVRSDGTINFQGKIYTSPSIAGAHARGKKTLNGWKSWKYKNERGEWVYLDALRKARGGSKNLPQKTQSEYDTIICPAHEDGFQETFLGKNCWYAIRLAAKRIPNIKYIAVYRGRPTSAITHYAAVKSIRPYKNTGKYIVQFQRKARKLRQPMGLGKGKRTGPQGPFFSTLKRIRAAKSLDQLRG